jgi:catechol 2,3-dioxygenase-like lactoylglutathione lyase family enzyme
MEPTIDFASRRHMHNASALTVALLLLSAAGVSGQVAATADAPVVYGHHHLNVRSIDEHRRFWVDALGGAVVRLADSPSVVIAFPRVLVFLREQAPSGGTKGSTVNHVGFQVPNLRAAVDALVKAGYPIVTRAELPPAYTEKDGLAFIPDQNTSVAFVMGPDETKVELVENKAMTGAIALHHIHFAAPQVEAMRDWYVKMFAARAGKRGAFEAADLPGVNLTYSGAPTPVAGTKGRVLDHIGFEVKNLQGLVERLTAMGVTFDRPFTRIAASGLAIAFFTDPWGTYIELTEGLDSAKASR